MIDENGTVPHGNGNGRLRKGQAVAITRGALTGMTGILDRFKDGQRCLIRLDVVQRGVLLIIDAAAVGERPAVPGTSSHHAASPRRQSDRDDLDCIKL